MFLFFSEQGDLGEDTDQENEEEFINFPTIPNTAQNHISLEIENEDNLEKSILVGESSMKPFKLLKQLCYFYKHLSWKFIQLFRN